MAKRNALITVTCPCCQAELHIDPATSAVIRHKEHEKPRLMADMEAAVSHYKGAADRREDAFKKSVEAHKSSADVLSRKFDEMLKIAKENPDEPPPKRDIDWD
jgi:cation transport regulator ChaB